MLDQVNLTVQCPEGGDILKGMCEQGLSTGVCEAENDAVEACFSG